MSLMPLLLNRIVKVNTSYYNEIYKNILFEI